ncbi:MAG TPA: hypothetical protein VGS22_03105 [Thermoanaerobaculia bacterium]|nr:hypothetical protein [Thermoanaerobaculia bacterium]
MKKRNRKMSLHRETVRRLSANDLDVGLAGGVATRLRTECGSCPASACHPTFCSPCEVTDAC